MSKLVVLKVVAHLADQLPSFDTTGPRFRFVSNHWLLNESLSTASFFCLLPITCGHRLSSK